MIYFTCIFVYSYVYAKNPYQVSPTGGDRKTISFKPTLAILVFTMATAGRTCEDFRIDYSLIVQRVSTQTACVMLTILTILQSAWQKN